MSDEGESRTSYSSSRSKKNQSSATPGQRTYANGGAAGARKADAPASWTRTPSSRAGADRRSKW